MIPTGIITIWSGAIVDIPVGWQLCNGDNGSPDLRDQFIVGAGTTYNPNDSGGNTQHLHSFTSDLHSHDIPAGTEFASGLEWDKVSDERSITGNTENTNHLPPYYSLAYIMFL